MIRYARFVTPLGTLFATAVGGALTGLYFEHGCHAPAIDASWKADPGLAPLRECARQIGEYLEGVRKQFDLPLAPHGTEFQRRVWIEIAGDRVERQDGTQLRREDEAALRRRDTRARGCRDRTLHRYAGRCCC